MTGEIRTYEVSVYVYGEARYCSRTPSQARMAAYRDFQSAVSSATFRDFLSRASLRRVENAPGCGERIMVGGVEVSRVNPPASGHYVYFMRDGESRVLCSHHMDVSPIMKGDGK